MLDILIVEDNKETILEVSINCFIWRTYKSAVNSNTGKKIPNRDIIVSV